MSDTEGAVATSTEAATTPKATKRPRGASFPSMSLSDAVAMIKKIASYGTTHTNAAVASFLGHSTANSGPYRSKIAALKDYGFLNGRGDDLNVTPLALEITHPGLDANIQASMRAAFLKCTLFQTVYTALPKDTELQVGALANSAMHNHNVAAQAKDTFATVFVKSGVAAGLIEEIDSDHVKLSDGHSAGTPEMDDAEDDVAPEPEPATQLSQGTGRITPPSLPDAKALVSHAWPISGGVVRFTVESSTPLPAAAYSVIGTVIAEGDKLAALLTETEVPVVVSGDTD